MTRRPTRPDRPRGPGARGATILSLAGLSFCLAACLGPPPRPVARAVSAGTARSVVERATGVRIRARPVSDAERAEGLVAAFRSRGTGAQVALGVFATAADAEREVTSVAGLVEAGPTPVRIRRANVVVVYLAAGGSRRGAGSVAEALDSV